MGLFGQKQLQVFDARMGAYSKVTDREAGGDKAVTLDRDEKEVIHECYPEDTFKRMGGEADDGKPSCLRFNVYDPRSGGSSEELLAIKYPKAEPKAELRLYFQKGANFSPTAKSIWFIFIRDGEDIPFVGYLDVDLWDNLIAEDEQLKAFERDYCLDDEDDAYQKALHSPKARKGAVESKVTRYPRDANLAATVLSEVNYTCQIDASHKTFIAASSGEPYVEAHHLVPMGVSDQYPEASLDVGPNIFALCPNCHRAIHYGEDDRKRESLQQLFEIDEKSIADAGIQISLLQLLKLYGVEEGEAQ
jgi:5-methylcytosine-specific restriction enzyme A